MSFDAGDTIAVPGALLAGGPSAILRHLVRHGERRRGDDEPRARSGVPRPFDFSSVGDEKKLHLPGFLPSPNPVPSHTLARGSAATPPPPRPCRSGSAWGRFSSPWASSRWRSDRKKSPSSPGDSAASPARLSVRPRATRDSSISLGAFPRSPRPRREPSLILSLPHSPTPGYVGLMSANADKLARNARVHDLHREMKASVSEPSSGSPSDSRRSRRGGGAEDPRLPWTTERYPTHIRVRVHLLPLLPLHCRPFPGRRVTAPARLAQATWRRAASIVAADVDDCAMRSSALLVGVPSSILRRLARSNPIARNRRHRWW